MSISLACLDWEQRIREGRSLIPDAAKEINPDEYNRAIRLFNLLRLPDVPGMPPMRDAAGDWFREIVGALLGSLDPSNNNRLIRELFALVPKKNSKTTGGAALMVTALLMNKRPRAEFLFIGPTQAISDLAFDQAAGMIENDPDKYLQKRFHLQPHLKQITDRKNKSELKIKTFDARVLTGVKPAGVLVDELHEIAKNPRASKIIGQLRGGMVSMPEAFLAFITTQSDEPPSGAFRAELQTARAIRDGRISGAMLPVLYEFPQDIIKDSGRPPAWQDPKNWPMVLPNLGKSITIGRLIEDFETAKTKGEAEINRWCSQHLNIEIGIGLHTDRWAGVGHWLKCANPDLTFDEILERCEFVVVGIDGGGLDDLLGFCVIGRDKITRKWLIWTHGWAHESVFAERQDIAAKLNDFVEAGDLTVVTRAADAHVQVADIVEEIESKGMFPDPAKKCIGVDQAGIDQIVEEITQRSIDINRIGAVQQGWKLNNAIKTLELKLADGDVEHCNQPIMLWQLHNAKVVAKGNAITIDKQISGSAKIDLLMAAFDAVKTMSEHSDGGKSVFDQLADADAAKGAASGSNDDDVDMTILADPAHPDWQKHRERWEAQNLSNGDDE